MTDINVNKINNAKVLAKNLIKNAKRLLLPKDQKKMSRGILEETILKTL